MLTGVGKLSREMGTKLELIANNTKGVDARKFRETLDWINNYSEYAF